MPRSTPHATSYAEASDEQIDRGIEITGSHNPAYIDLLLAGLDGVNAAALAGMRIGWDAGNGAAGPALEQLAVRLPDEHHLLYTSVDGNFLNHLPDPMVEANLEDLRALVLDKGLDFGIAFDSDGDRIGAIEGEGRVIWATSC